MIDIVRINPYFNAITTNNTVTAVSVAGRNARYNNIQIDGAVNNDLFGLAETGTPGGNTDSQPISLDAIQELQLVVSSYDVRQSGFSGGGINAITKSGTNKLTGSAFFFGRNQDWIGKGVTGLPVSTFSDKQGGFSVGGRIVENKAFFFGNMDWGRKQTPTGFCVSGCAQPSRAPAADVDRIISILENKYGYTVPDLRRRILQDDELGQVPREIRFQREAQSSSDGAAQLRQRAERHRGHRIDIELRPAGRLLIASAARPTARSSSSTRRWARRSMSSAWRSPRFGTAAPGSRSRTTHRSRASRSTRRSRASACRSAARTSPTANELDQDIIELHDDYTMIKGKHTDYARHAQRVLRLPQPVHRRQLRHLHVQHHRQVRPGTGAVVCLRLLGHAEPAAGGAVRREPGGLLRG
jgi:hypothetical protein